jgi:hypothetical protein
MQRSPVTLAVINGVAFLATVVVNGLANGLPLNGRGTGEISDLYPNLFVPAGLTFSIWGLIYLLLLGFCTYGLVHAIRAGERATSVLRIGPFFIVSSLANIGWIFAWHWQRMGLSVALMLILLTALIVLYLRLEIGKQPVDLLQKVFFHLPFSVYLGWITVATIANVTALLVSVEWGGAGLSEAVWTIGVLVVAVAITCVVIVTRRDLGYALVVVWALIGIYLKRSADLAEPAPAVAMTALAGAGGLVVLVVLARFLPRREASSRHT